MAIHLRYFQGTNIITKRQMSKVGVPHLLSNAVNDGVPCRESHYLIIATSDYCGDWDTSTHCFSQDKSVS